MEEKAPFIIATEKIKYLQTTLTGNIQNVMRNIYNTLKEQMEQSMPCS